MKIPVKISENEVEIEFSSEIEENFKEIEIILDYSFEDELLGFEVLNLLFQTNKNLLDRLILNEINESQFFNISYDEDADAFYLKFNKANKQNSTRQELTKAEISTDKKGYLNKIRFKK